MSDTPKCTKLFLSDEDQEVYDKEHDLDEPVARAVLASEVVSIEVRLAVIRDLAIRQGWDRDTSIENLVGFNLSIGELLEGISAVQLLYKKQLLDKGSYKPRAGSTAEKVLNLLQGEEKSREAIMFSLISAGYTYGAVSFALHDLEDKDLIERTQAGGYQLVDRSKLFTLRRYKGCQEENHLTEEQVEKFIGQEVVILDQPESKLLDRVTVMFRADIKDRRAVRHFKEDASTCRLLKPESIYGWALSWHKDALDPVIIP